MKYSWSKVLGGAIDAAVILVAAAVIAATFASDSAGKAVRLSKEDWSTVIAGGRSIGSPKSRVTLVEFVDYQCPVCARLEPIIAQLQESNPNELRRVIRHYPIRTLHKNAEDAAVALECASDQGRLAEMHTALLADQALIAEAKWDTIATMADVKDLSIFRACLSSPSARERVRRDVELGDAMGVSGTPAFLIDGEWLAGMTPPELRNRIQRKLR